MAFSISTRSFPSRRNFTSYAKAKQVHDSIKPLRNSDVRPLNSNRRGSYYIRIDPYDQAVELVYYSTAVVRVLPNDTMELNLSRNSMSTRLFANAFAPVQISTYQGGITTNDATGEYLTDRATIDLASGEIISGKTRLEVRRVNRKRVKEPARFVRKMRDWLDMAEALDPEYFTRIRFSHGERFQNFSQVVIDDAETWVEQVLQPIMRDEYRRGRLPSTIKRAVYDYYEVYDWELLPEGTLPAKGATYRKVTL